MLRPELRIYIRPRRMGLNLLRNTVHYASQFLLGAQPHHAAAGHGVRAGIHHAAWTALLAVWLLSEKMTPSRFGVVVLGLYRRSGDPAAGPRQLQSGGDARASGGLWLCNHHDRHQEADHDRNHIRQSSSGWR
ncbi:MAG: hypothetical protein WDN48_09265 [Pseudolabrys sp.]